MSEFLGIFMIVFFCVFISELMVAKEELKQRCDTDKV